MTKTEEQAYADKRHDDYLAERERLIEGELDCARNFDKYLITLSSGALALSVAFIEKIAPKPTHLWAIYVSWAGFIVSLLLILASMLASQLAFGRQRDILDERYEQSLVGETDQSTTGGCEVNRFASATIFLTMLAKCVFIVGVCFFAIFGGLNLQDRGDEMEKKSPKATSSAPTGMRSGKPPTQAVERPKPQQGGQNTTKK